MSGLGVSPNTAAGTPSASTVQTPSDRPEPKGPTSVAYRPVPADGGQNEPKPEEEAGAPTKARRGCWEAVQDYTWTLELLSLVLAIASTAAICVILGLWDGRLLRDWPLPIQPNSLVSVFSTLAKTALALPAASVISQMKWVWFEEPRRLADLQTFDRASRGPWGALQLVWDTRGRAWITKAACILSIVALAYEPTAQQVLSYEARETLSNNATASLSIAKNWTAASLQTDAADFSKQVAVQSLLLSAFGPKAQNNSVPRFQCTAPTCHWQNVSTLGACSKCQGGPRPVSTLVRNGTNSFLARPPISDVPVGPATLTNASEFPTLALQPQVFRFDMDAPNGMHMPDYSLMKFAAVNYTAAGSAARDGGGGNGWVWEQGASVDYYLCRIHPCVQTFADVTVRNGEYQASEPTTKWLVQDEAASKEQDGIIRYRAEEEAGSFPDWAVSFYTAERVNSLLGNMLSGSMPKAPRSLSFGRNGGTEYGVTQYVLEHGPDAVMRALAQILSAQMRDEDNLAAQNLTGVALEPQTFVVVNWAWMAGPLGILALTAATLVFAMVRNASRPLAYKESAVALLSLGVGHLDADGQHVRGNPMGERYTAYQAEVVASELSAKLHRDSNGEYMFVKC
ncbi:uncharacterized protein PG986_014270 [Apiospora aurea]|uniref:RanBP2-type domain-containing protein n=1 Tax=Apiospora aurea TaxID=335848 RepID=A0ABR1PSH6_9PEZI